MVLHAKSSSLGTMAVINDISLRMADCHELDNGINSQLVMLSLNLLIIELIKQSCSVGATIYYFKNRVVNIWNSPTLSTFKSRLQNHDLSSWLIEFTL